MYDELIKRLRECTAEMNGEKTLWHQAADAIEELQKITTHYEEESKGWWLAACDAKEERERLKEQIPKWIPVTERLPEVGKKVLVFAYGNDTLTARMQKRTENGYPVFECNGIFLEMAKLGRISHWMPLPQPPKEG